MEQIISFPAQRLQWLPVTLQRKFELLPPMSLSLFSPWGPSCSPLGAPGLLAILKPTKLFLPQALSMGYFFCLESSFPRLLSGSIMLLRFLLQYYHLRGTYLTTLSKIRHSEWVEVEEDIGWINGNRENIIKNKLLKYKKQNKIRHLFPWILVFLSSNFSCLTFLHLLLQNHIICSFNYCPPLPVDCKLKERKNLSGLLCILPT